MTFECRCTHPCNLGQEDESKPICPLAATEEIAVQIFPEFCQDEDGEYCEWFWSVNKN